MEAVVVFPWVPATARQLRVRRWRPASRTGGRPGSPGCAPRPARDSRAAPRARGGRRTSASASATFSRRCPTATAMPRERRRSATGESLRSEPDTVWPIARSTDAIALMPAPPMPTTWMRRGTRGPAAPGGRRQRAWASTSSATRAAASGARAHGRRRAIERKRAGSPSGTASSSSASRSPVHSGSGTCAPHPCRPAPRHCAPGGPGGRRGAAPRMAGTPATSSSATVMAPARDPHTSAAAYRSGVRSSKGTTR